MTGSIGKRIRAYATKVGYMEDLLGDQRVIGSEAEWAEYVKAVSQRVYDGQGNESLIRPKGLGEYGQGFFDGGSRLAVSYQPLSSGSYNPSVISCDVNEATGILVIEYKHADLYGMALTMDMSGCVIVAEIPAGVDFEDIEVNRVP